MSSQIRLGVIGYGERTRHMVRLMQNQDLDVRLVAIADPKGEELQEYLRADNPDADNPRFYMTAEAMLDAEPLDGVVVGTRCSLHAAMGVKVLERGLALFLEKPVATTLPDLLALRAVQSPRVVVSFPLRMSRLVQLARRIIAEDRIGTVEQVQAWNNVPYGNVYFQTWYRDEKETQGLFLQKATHDFDYINYLLGGNQPRIVSAMTSKRVFRGSHPAGLRCMDCPEKPVCLESPYRLTRAAPLALNQTSPTQCAFAVDTGNEDSGSALIEYESGMHVSYSQNFYTRNEAARRGARLIGHKGTIEFDWYPEQLRVYSHADSHIETHAFETSDGHGGGDAVLAANFLAVTRGEAVSVSPMDNGLFNGLLCLKAKESAATRRFQEIEWPAGSVAPPQALGWEPAQRF